MKNLETFQDFTRSGSTNGPFNIPLSDFELNAILAQPQPPQQLSDEQAVASILQKRWEQISEERSWAQFLRQQDHEQIWKKPDIFEEFGNSPGISPEEDQLEVDQLMGLSIFHYRILN
ncbi:MAG: hypothetical protein H6925_04685 [Holosporaceae bacterium]|nr:MAG: hypothetical protein H6925_04685 [Holosporaceae bacterium]